MNLNERQVSSSWARTRAVADRGQHNNRRRQTVDSSALARAQRPATSDSVAVKRLPTRARSRCAFDGQADAALTLRGREIMRFLVSGIEVDLGI